MALSVQVQTSPGCGHGRTTIEIVAAVLAELAPHARLAIHEVRTMEDAERLGFRGSPTVLVDGVDIEPGPPPAVALG